MLISVGALIIGFVMDLILGDPRSIPHPVVIIGKLIYFLEKILRKAFPKTVKGENLAGLVLWIIVCVLSFGVPFALLLLCRRVGW